MNWLEKRVENFALGIARKVIDSMHDEMNQIRNKIVHIAENVKPIPGYVMLEAPDGMMAVSPIVFLVPGERVSIKICIYKEFPEGSVMKVNNPLFMQNIRIGSQVLIISDEDGCMTCKLTEKAKVSQMVSCDIIYPKK